MFRLANQVESGGFDGAGVVVDRCRGDRVDLARGEVTDVALDVCKNRWCPRSPSSSSGSRAKRQTLRAAPTKATEDEIRNSHDDDTPLFRWRIARIAAPSITGEPRQRGKCPSGGRVPVSIDRGS